MNADTYIYAVHNDHLREAEWKRESKIVLDEGDGAEIENIFFTSNDQNDEDGNDVQMEGGVNGRIWSDDEMIGKRSGEQDHSVVCGFAIGSILFCLSDILLVIFGILQVKRFSPLLSSFPLGLYFLSQTIIANGAIVAYHVRPSI